MKNVFESTNVKNEIPFNIRLRKLIKYAGYNTDSWGWSREVAQDMYNKELLDLKHEYRGKDAYEDGNDAIDRLLTSAANRIRQHTSEKYTHASMITGAWLYRYCQFFQCSAAYLFGEIDNFTAPETDIQKKTGLSPRAVRQLLQLKKNTARMPIAAEMLDTLSAILSRPDPMADFLQCVGNILGTCTYTASGGLVEDLPEIQTNDPAFIRVVQDRRLAMAIDNLKKTKK